MRIEPSTKYRTPDIWPDATPVDDIGWMYSVNGYELPKVMELPTDKESIYNGTDLIDFINNNPYDKVKSYIPSNIDGPAGIAYARQLMNDKNYAKFLNKAGVTDPYKQYDTKFKIGNYEYSLPELALIYNMPDDDYSMHDIYDRKFEDFIKEENAARRDIFKKGGKLPSPIVDDNKDWIDGLSNKGLLKYHIDENGDAVIDKVSNKLYDEIYLNTGDEYKDFYRRNSGLENVDDEKEIEFLRKFIKDAIEDKVENNPEEIINDESIPQSLKDEAQQIVDNNDKRDDEVNNANVEKALRNTIPGSEPDPLGLNISNEERTNWNGGEDRAVDDATISEMDNALASRTRPVRPGSEMLDSAKPKGLLGAGMLYSRDNKIPKPSEERPLDANSLEQITESNPEAVQEALPDTPIAEEARQITDDSDARNDEVNNEAAEETIGMGWNNGLVHDDYDPRIEANNEYDYPEDVGNPGVITGKDEDFAGPDELPATIDQIRDEDFVGPDEQLVPSDNRDLVPPPPPPPTDDYNHDFDYNIEEVDRQPGIPEEPEIQTKITDVNDMGLLKARPTDIGGSSVPSVPQAPLAGAETHTGGNAIGTKGILPKGSLGYSAPYIGSASTPKTSSYNGSGKVGTIGKAAVNTDASVVTGKQSESSGFVTNNGGNLDSGATNFRSSLAHIQPAKLPSEVEEHTSPAVNGLLGAGSGNIREALISRLNMLLDKVDKETLKKLGFSPSDHNYKGTPLNKLDGATLRELVDMVESAID